MGKAVYTTVVSRKRPELDDIDRKILEILQVNAKTPYREIAEKLGIAISTVHDRIKRLERKGIIRGYTVALNPLFKPSSEEIFACLRVRSDRLSDFINEVSKIHEVAEIFESSGEYNIVLRIVTDDKHRMDHILNRLKKNVHVERMHIVVGLRKYLHEIYKFMSEDSYKILRGLEAPVRPNLGSSIPLILLRHVIVTAHTISPDAKKLFYQAGFEWGNAAFYKWCYGENLEEVLYEYIKALKSLRWAIAEVTFMSSNEAVLELHECAICYGAPNIGMTVCSFQAGNLAGVLNKVLNKKATVVETRCLASGHNVCKFHVYLE